MDENVALDSSKQHKFLKSVRGIKKLLKKNEEKPKAEASKEVKDPEDKRKKKRIQRGLVYLSHIPHGFYENEMTQYFKQFGVVTNARVIRSKRTGNSKGHAFVEFKEPAVAQIVAETMNNYLMGKRLLKAAYIPPEKQRPAMRKHWSATHNPASENRLKIRKAHNADKDEKGDLQKARKLLNNLTKNKTKLAELGINYDFFTPVDVPDVLLNNTENLHQVNISEEKENNKKSKKGQKVIAVEVKKENSKAVLKTGIKQEDPKKDVKTKQEAKKDNVKVQEPKTTKKEQKQKKQNLKDKGVQPLEEFIKVGESDNDSSDEFDSDEFSKMMEDDSDASSDVGSDEEEEASEATESDDEDSSVEDCPPPKQKGKPVQKFVHKPSQQVVKKNAKQQEVTQPQMKRKAPQKPISPKKTKFEKQKPVGKQFRKKK